jgi:sRNA-binding carbon storage regulator CsrA
MLTLTRRPGQRIVCRLPSGELMILTVSAIHQQLGRAPTVQLSWDAPDEIDILRGELHDQQSQAADRADP